MGKNNLFFLKIMPKSLNMYSYFIIWEMKTIIIFRPILTHAEQIDIVCLKFTLVLWFQTKIL